MVTKEQKGYVRNGKVHGEMKKEKRQGIKRRRNKHFENKDQGCEIEMNEKYCSRK